MPDRESQIEHRKSRVVIAGAGPAGSSLAIRLAKAGFEVVLIEREKFPRHKLCGEFVSPECIRHFNDLGVGGQMLDAAGDRIVATNFYSQSGRSVSVPSEWLGGDSALGISRDVMDATLIEEARRAGAEVFEETSLVEVERDGDRVGQLSVRTADGSRRTIGGDLFVDATGRSCVLANLVRRKISGRSGTVHPERRYIGFKAHLENVDLEPGVCEIYLFDGGYGGLNFVGNGVANHCFLVTSETFKAAGSVSCLLDEVVYRNPRARKAMENSRPLFDWLAVSVGRFGRKELTPTANLFTVGDSAAFIDPFTGSGMLLALESAELLADAIVGGHDIGAVYTRTYEARFAGRLRVSGLLRGAASWPRAASGLIASLSASRSILRRIARATRGERRRTSRTT
ncbi:MAG TPA: FAD-dependent monooxygenase [Pyrinomonadaceae bacterium]|nr:FAD-dependent monooxygenase [Pyrinomonadaceae bacterium]